ncbi:copper resistance CopC family protein [Neobacillus sp. FSL H8-0543]|uniref:copper resistance CopC family protein n=1 Tax=Neobacillus sp. FSL H8-0543 TaxID=2954672 RepID=UPI0031594679
MMLNKITLISTLLFFLLGSQVFAHSHLADSTPKNGEVLNEPLKNITLSFETVLEQTSSFILIDSNGKALPLSELALKENQLLGTLEEELPNGDYTIQWKIIGTDGHQLEGDVPFTVQLPESTNATETSETVEPSDQATETETLVPAKEVISENEPLLKKDEIQKASIKAYIVPGLIGLIIILGFSCYWFIFKRKHA